MNGLLRLSGAIAVLVTPLFTALAAQGAVILVNTPGATALSTAHGSAAAGDTLILAKAGNYGPATITEAITIIALDGAGTFSPVNKPCLIINVTASQAVITLKGYTCDVGGATQDGIRLTNGHRLIMEDITVRNAAGTRRGLNYRPADGPAGFNITRSSFLRNGLTGGGGICIDPNNDVAVNGILDTVISQNGTAGVKAKGGLNAPVDLLISDSHFALNGTGLSSDGANSILKVSNSTISANGVGLSSLNGGQIISLQGNSVSNFTNGSFSDTIEKQ